MATNESRLPAFICRLSIFVVVSALHSISVVQAQQNYVWPEAETSKAGRYPVAAQVDGAEALVNYTYLIDETGQVTDIQITQLLGEQVFESRVIELLQQRSFAPALLDGKPVPSWEHQRHVFLIDGKSRGAKNSFVVHWKRFIRKLGEGDYNAAEKYIRKMEKVSSRSLYEELYLQHAAATLATTQGKFALAYPHLQKAHSLMIYGFGEEGGLIGPADLYYNLLLDKYQIEAERLLLGDAMETRNALQEIYPEAENTSIVEDHLSSLLEKVSGKEFQVEVSLEPGVYSTKYSGWGTWLVSRSFALSDINGKLEQVILDCNRGQLFLEVSGGARLEAPEGWGACKLVILGDLGTTLKLAQRRR